MKILAIRIKNLASLEGTTEIDFTSEPLASAGIFAITGPTGAGKSTLLDALCLALYGKTPRYLQAKEMGIELQDVNGSTLSQGDVRGILRDGTAEGFAEVDFVGTDGQWYRCNWSVRRARNKADGSMQADAITLKNLTTNLDLPGKKAETYKEIERLVGLNFEQFTRSVLLAQGDFTAFMKASKDEKSSLLEKLTGTHIYSAISKKIFESFRAEETKLRELNVRREGIATLSEEEVVKIKEEESVLGNQISKLTDEIEALNKELTWHEQLVVLTTSKEAAVVTLQKANTALEQAGMRKQKLAQIERAQTTRSWHDAMQYNQKQVVEQQKNLGDLKVKSTALTTEKDLLEKQYAKEDLQLTTVKAVQKEAVPLLAIARKLDTLVSEKEKQKSAAVIDVTIAQKKQGDHLKLMTDKETEIVQVSAEITQIKEWQTKYTAKKPIAENKDLIVSKLTDAQELLHLIYTATDEKKTLVTKIETTTEAIKSQTAAFEQLEHTYKTHQNKWNEQSKELLLIPIEAITMQKDATDISLTETVESVAFWKVLHALKVDCTALQNKQTTDQKRLVALETSSTEWKKQLAAAKTSKETSETLLQKARLIATENVQSLRENLQDQEPCPVCGSEEHPYASHNPQLDSVLKTLETEHLKNNDRYLQHVQALAKVTQEHSSLSDIVLKQATELAVRSTSLKAKEREWQQKSVFTALESTVDEEKTTWLEAQIKDLRTRQEALNNQIKVHTDLRKVLELDKNKLETLKEETTLKSVQLQESRSQLALFVAQLSGVEKQISQNDGALLGIRNSLSPYFSSLDWLENWQKEPHAFVTQITNFAQQWQQHAEKLEFSKNQHSLATAALKQLQTQSKVLVEELAQKTEAFQTLETTFVQLKTERNAIYNGQAADVMEQQFTQVVEQAQKNVEVVKNKLQENTLQQTTAATQSTTTATSLAKYEAELQNNLVKIENWLQEYQRKFQQTLSILELNTLLHFTSDWIETERTALNSLEKEQTQATSVLKERTQLLHDHLIKRPSERLLEALNLAYENTKNTLEAQKQAKATLGFQLNEDAQNKIRIGSLLNEISAQNKVTDNWNKLNDIIGSSDGKKFRQIAQEYTLDALLSFANIHLEVLTNRYKIERIPNTLGLQVVDQDMGDEIRTVYSLSGGESFLVSLALALGLASLSSSKMKVESLFIDEGFGSLDPNTLNIAMDALERLHNQGRKVGVISHVQEMTERIPVQIKVSKRSSGKSKVEVLGF